ncbi:PIN domain-containing protein [Paenibacillus sp. IB182496]|uniref:PIN domain-containing protein n=1 Tax=Paenibacillus sabuli TaxID=2772509 RepID=A0A927BRS2_9BACL|nr:PIN domain-containing protein [Paenibacillus sabuli]
MKTSVFLQELDANIILRYLLQDAEPFIEQATEKMERFVIYIPNEVLAEVVYVLEKVYQVERTKICSVLQGLISYKNISTHDYAVLFESLQVYAEINIEWMPHGMVWEFSLMSASTIGSLFDSEISIGRSGSTEATSFCWSSMFTCSGARSSASARNLSSGSARYVLRFMPACSLISVAACKRTIYRCFS